MRPVSKNTVDHRCSLSTEMTSRYSFFTKFCGFHCGHKKNTTITDYNSHCVAAGNVFGPLWNTSRSPNGLVCHQRDISDDKVFNCHALTMHNDLSNPISAAERAIPPPQWWSGERGGFGVSAGMQEQFVISYLFSCLHGAFRSGGAWSHCVTLCEETVARPVYSDRELLSTTQKPVSS